ncbi:MAG TPA: hypothetical protein VEW92_04275 [Nitrososphaeraceae archaeon]|jgi:hypothetical protein|nr:hypothetical protein [Nitrososphaeraceae archaeon]
MLKEEKTILKYIKFLTIKAKYHVVELVVVDSYFKTAIGITPSLRYFYRIQYSEYHKGKCA